MSHAKQKFLPNNNNTMLKQRHMQTTQPEHSHRCKLYIKQINSKKKKKNVIQIMRVRIIADRKTLQVPRPVCNMIISPEVYLCVTILCMLVIYNNIKRIVKNNYYHVVAKMQFDCESR